MVPELLSRKASPLMAHGRPGRPATSLLHKGKADAGELARYGGERDIVVLILRDCI